MDHRVAPSAVPVPGTEGYAERAAAMVAACESISFETVHAPVLHLMPTAPGRALDIGAGSGRDAAALAERGFEVVAVEPVAELRRRAAELHRSPRIAWRDDQLPRLAALDGEPDGFDLVLLHAVWMHLDATERVRAMPRVAGLLRPRGVLLLSLRHGPVPAGKRMFDVGAGETIRLAESAGLSPCLRLDGQPSALAKPDVTWTRLAFHC